MSQTVAISIAAAGLGAGLAVLLISVWRGVRLRRGVRRRIASLVTRLDSAESGEEVEKGMPLDIALERLDSAIESLAIGGDLRRTDVERLLQGLEHLDLGLIVVDEVGEVVLVNAQARDYIEGRHGRAVAQARIQEMLQGCISAAAPVEEEIEIFGPPRRNLRISAVPLDDGQRGLGALVAVSDVTESRKVEAMRRDFVANVSHELQTPVGAMALSAEILADEDDPEIAGRLAQRIRDESGRLARVIKDLLDLSHLESEASPPREPLPISLIMAEAVERVRSLAELAQVRMTVWEAEPGLVVMGDRRNLVAAAVNLLENAVAYSDPGSVIEIGTAPSPDGGVDVWVADEGVGIPEKDLERVFERFYRVDRGRGRLTGGTGLGLAIVRHVANNHGATVDVFSTEGEGSRFTIHFPADRRVIAAGARMAGGPPGNGSADAPLGGQIASGSTEPEAVESR